MGVLLSCFMIPQSAALALGHASIPSGTTVLIFNGFPISTPLKAGRDHLSAAISSSQPASIICSSHSEAFNASALQSRGWRARSCAHSPEGSLQSPSLSALLRKEGSPWEKMLATASGWRAGDTFSASLQFSRCLNQGPSKNGLLNVFRST